MHENVIQELTHSQLPSSWATNRTHLSGGTKGVTEVNANNTASVRLDHEVGEVPVPNAQNPVTHAYESVTGNEMAS